MAVSSKPAIQIDLNEFKLHLHLKGRTQLTLHFNSPSRRFYLSVIALVVNEMKKAGKIKSIPLQEHLDLLILLNESIGGAAGSSEKENLLYRVYRKWKDALPNLEEAPLFRVLGRKKEEEDGAIGKVYAFTDAEKDEWANLFEYMGSEENVRLRFAIDRIGIGLDGISITFGDARNAEAWEQFISGLKDVRQVEEVESEVVEEVEVIEVPVIPEATIIPESPPIPIPPPQERRVSWLFRYRWLMGVGVAGIVLAVIWRIYLSPAPVTVASVDRMKYPLPDKPSIAVLPFVNMSEDAKQEYFSDGMTEDLITDLSKISGLFVIARNSTFAYKGKPVKVKQIAEELGVRYVLEGSVRRAGDEVRINAQLVDVMTGHHLWAERYDGKMEGIFALQDQITQRIVSALAVKLTGTEKQIVARKGTDNIAAYDAYLEGWDHYYRYTPDSFEKGAASFKKAIELDSNYAQAYAALANLYCYASDRTALLPGLKMSRLEAWLRTPESLKVAMKKPTPIAYRVSSEMHLRRRQHKEAISELEKGLALDPNNADCIAAMGRVLTFAGRPKEGIEYLNRGMRLNPGDRYEYLNSLSMAHFCMGEVAEAAKLLEQVLRINPENLSPATTLAGFYGALGRDQDARAMLDIRKKGAGAPLDLGGPMFREPFSDRAVADRYAGGLLKAGLPPARISGGYSPAFKENQLTGEEIKKLLFGAKRTGIGPYDGQQWWTELKKNGESTWRGPGPISSDTGKSRIEGDMLCTRLQKMFWGLEYCATVFRNPGGTYESKDEHFLCTDLGFAPFSLVK